MACAPSCYDLRTQISIERAAAVDDALGGRGKTWSVIEQPWAEVKAAGMSEGYYADGRNTRDSYRVTIRFTDVTEKDRIVIDGVVHAVVSVQDPDRRKRWLVLRVTKGVAP